jgi:hypothetical protein
MAAGLGFKDFVTGEVLTAADVDGYLMQGVWVFASAAARDAAVTSPQEGNFAYLKDTNVTTYYTGSAWANLDTTGMTNPMTTTGDTIYSSSGSTPARLGIGSTGNVLTVSGGVPTWAAPAGGALTIAQISTGNVNSGTSTTISSLSSYDNLLIMFKGLTTATTTPIYQLKINNTASNYYYAAGCGVSSSSANQRSSNVNAIDLNVNFGSVTGNADNLFMIQLTNCKSTGFTNIQWSGAYKEYSTNANGYSLGTGIFANAAAVSSLVITTDTGATFNGTGTYTIWGA